MGKSRAKARKPPKQDQAVTKIGYDGNQPIFRPARDIVGQGKRETIDGPQNINIDRLEWMLDRQYIEPHHHAAGRKLQYYWEIVNRSGGMSLLGGGRGGSSMTSLSDAKCDAHAAMNTARAAISPMNWRIIELVVLDNMSSTAAMAKMRFNADSATSAVKLALDSLAQHYGLCMNGRK